MKYKKEGNKIFLTEMDFDLFNVLNIKSIEFEINPKLEDMLNSVNVEEIKSMPKEEAMNQAYRIGSKFGFMAANIVKEHFAAKYSLYTKQELESIDIYSEEHYNPDRLKLIKNIMPYMEIEEIAHYADLLCKVGFGDDDAIAEIFELDIWDEEILREMNTAVWGNCAYISIHHEDKVIRSRYKILINNLKAFYKGENLTPPY